MHLRAERGRYVGQGRRAGDSSAAGVARASVRSHRRRFRHRQVEKRVHEHRRDRSTGRRLSAPDAGVPHRASLHHDGLRCGGHVAASSRPSTHATRYFTVPLPGATSSPEQGPTGRARSSADVRRDGLLILELLDEILGALNVALILRRVRRQAQILAELRGGIVVLGLEAKQLTQVVARVVVVRVDADDFAQRGGDSTSRSRSAST